MAPKNQGSEQELRAVSMTKEAAMAFQDSDVNGDKKLSFQEVRRCTICYHASLPYFAPGPVRERSSK